MSKDNILKIHISVWENLLMQNKNFFWKRFQKRMVPEKIFVFIKAFFNLENKLVYKVAKDRKMIFRIEKVLEVNFYFSACDYITFS